MTLAAITNHVERGLGRLIEQFKGKPRLEAWISSYLEEVQELSDAAWDVLISRLIDSAVNEQLVVLGRIVGQLKTTTDDERFRVLVRARIAINKSNGRWNELLRIIKLLLGDGVPYGLTPYYPGALVLMILGAITFVPTLEHEMLEDAAAGGVRVDVHFSEVEPDELFYFGGGPGFGGGSWAGAVSDHTVV